MIVKSFRFLPMAEFRAWNITITPMADDFASRDMKYDAEGFTRVDAHDDFTFSGNIDAPHVLMIIIFITMMAT